MGLGEILLRGRMKTRKAGKAEKKPQKPREERKELVPSERPSGPGALPSTPSPSSGDRALEVGCLRARRRGLGRERRHRKASVGGCREQVRGARQRHGEGSRARKALSPPSRVERRAERKHWQAVARTQV